MAHFGHAASRRPDGCGPIAYTWQAGPVLVRAALCHGFEAYLSKALPAPRLLTGLLQITAGHTVVDVGRPSYSDEPPATPIWPGDGTGLTPRQADIIALVTAGATNAEIAAALHLRINTVKSYIRAAYRTIGVRTRDHAVLWGLCNGFAQPCPVRDRHTEQ